MNTSDYTILIADDNPENLTVLSKILEDKGYRTRTAKNGQLALNSMLTVPPDLALIDIHMPVMDGYELCKELKSHSETEDIPVLFVSALGESFNKVIAFDLGAVDYISKPVDAQEVLARVQTHLKIVELQKSLKEQNQLLERKVSERTDELNEALSELRTIHKRLQSLDHAKSQFLNLISHELRTPLIGLGIFDELLNGKELSDEDAKEYQNIFWSSHQKLLNIIDHATVLTQLKLDAPSYRYSQLSLKQLIEDSCASLKSLMGTQEVGVEIQDCEPPSIICDRDYFKIMMNALMETAIKFTQPGKSVKVSWESLPEGILFHVESSGWTLPSHCKEKFFEVLGIQETLFPGGDLGLAPAVAKHVLNAFGGKVEVRNLEEQGILLTATLPLVDGQGVSDSRSRLTDRFQSFRAQFW